MNRSWLGIVFAATIAAVVISPQKGLARAQQPDPGVAAEQTPADEAPEGEEASPCAALAPQRLGGVLSAVPRYGSTYVLVVPDRLAATVPGPTAPAVGGLHVGVTGGDASREVARSLGIANIDEYPVSATAPSQLLQDVKDGKLDAGVLWAPLAGLGILELGLDGVVSVYTVDKPHPAPASLHAASISDPCASAIADELDVNGVLPAELLVTVELRDLLSHGAPKFDLAQARDGAPLFNDTCARCHGPDAVADPKGLAPVDLRLSVRRFSYPGFHYIVLNGRPLKSMPGFRGTVTDEQIALIYQYLKARSNNVLPASSQTPATPAE